NAALEQLFDALPHLVDWVQRDERWPNRDFAALYRRVCELMLLSGDRTPSTLGALSQILDGLLALGMEPTDYAGLLKDLREALPSLGGAHNIDWLVDLAELTVVYPCADSSARAALWTQIAVQVTQLASRLSPTQVAVLKDIGAILGMAEALALPA